MNKYELLIIVGDRLEHHTVFAETFDTTTSASTSAGFYAFYADRKIIKCYPIDRTIIASIEECDESF